MHHTVYLTGASNRAVRDIAKDRGIGLLVQPGNGRSYVPHISDYVAWAADNGCFSPTGKAFDADAWFAWLTELSELGLASSCLFATAPDIVGDAAGTLARSEQWLPRIRQLGFPVALVAQDGLESLSVPWADFDVLFLGGSTEWKLSHSARRLVLQARALGKRTHMGRVNSGRRFSIACDWGVDTADGTFLAYGPTQNLQRLLGWYDQQAA